MADTDPRTAAVAAAGEARFAALIAVDLKALERILADELVYTHGTSQVDDKPAMIAGVAKKEAVWLRATRNNQKIRFFGDVAVATGRADLLVRSVKGDNPASILYTEVWISRGGAWQLASYHSCSVRKT